SPQGMAFAPDGNLLVSTSAGDILRFSPTGEPLGNFVTGLGNGLAKIALGFQGPTNRAFAAHLGGRLLSFDVAPDGTGIPGPVVTNGGAAPIGVAVGTGNAAPTRAGTDITVALNTFTSTFATISTSGLTEAACGEYKDPRERGCGPEGAACGPEGGEGVCEAGYCKRDLPLVELTRGRIDHGTIIPAYVRGFGKGSPNGFPTFLVCQTVTTARFGGAITHIEEEHEWLRWPHVGPVGPGNGEPPCRDTDPGGDDRTQQVRSFWAPTPGAEPGIVEGNRFVDISTGCTGSNRSNPPNYSLLLPAVRDTRTVPEVVADKLDHLLATVADFRARGFITP